MSVTRHEILKLQTSEDIVRVRQAVRAWMVEMKFGLVDQTKNTTFSPDDLKTWPGQILLLSGSDDPEPELASLKGEEV